MSETSKTLHETMIRAAKMALAAWKNGWRAKPPNKQPACSPAPAALHALRNTHPGTLTFRADIGPAS